MIRHDCPGKFIVLEGLDGSGKTTQANKLQEYFEQLNKLVLVTKEPTLKSQAGQVIQRVLIREMPYAPFALQKLYAKDRRQHIRNIISPNLKDGVIVVCDRYFLSSIAYGGIDVDIDNLIRLNKDVIEPDITFILDTSAKECMERIEKTRDQTELFERTDKLTKVLENYEKIQKKFDNVFLINGQKTKDEVFEQILSLLIYSVSEEYFKEEVV